MKTFWRTAGSIAVWAALAVYLVWAARQCTSRERDTPARGVEVTVRDSARMAVITPGMVKAWIAAENLIPANCAASEIPLGKIERLVSSRGFVKDARVYMDMDGVVHISLSQRRPVMRFNTASGYNFYITDDGYVLPLQPHAPMWLPIITGNYVPPFERGYVGALNKAPGADEKKLAENYRFLYNLINFVGFIRDDSFWSAQVEQVNVNCPPGSDQGIGIYDPQVEIIPRAGNHVVMLGGLDGYREKLDKLMKFYRGGLRYEGWDTYRYINLKYKNQIVCTK